MNDHRLSDVLLVGPLPSRAIRKSRACRETQRQNKDQTKRFHDSLFSLGNFLAGAGGRQIEMLRLNEFVNGFINFQLTKGTVPE